MQQSWLPSFYRSLDQTKRRILWIISLIILLGCIKAGYYTFHYGGTDLRDRTVASRMLDSGRIVYSYRWTPGQPERLLNPNAPHDGLVNGVTAPPGTLYVQALFASLPYPILRIAWTAFQYLLAIYIFLSFLRKKDTAPDNAFNIILIGGLFFLCSQIWFFHIERGQVYILYAFFFAAFYQLYRLEKPIAKYAAGIVVAIAIYCRPSFVVFVIPLLISWNKKVMTGLAGASLLLLLHAWIHRDLWQGYLSAMSIYTDPVYARSPQAAPDTSIYPSIIEGAKNLSLYKTDFVCGGISPLATWIDPLLHLTSNSLYIVLYCITAIALTAIYRKKIVRANPGNQNNVTAPANIALFAFLLYMTAEYIMPAQRGGYHMVIWIFPVLLFLQKPRLPQNSLIVIITGLFFINGFPFWFPFIHDIGELLLTTYLLVYLYK